MNGTLSPTFTGSSIIGPGLGSSADPYYRASVPGERRNLEDPSKPITAQQLAELLGGGSSSGQQIVTPGRSLMVSTVFACVRVVANAIARMPLVTYERTSGGRQRATGHPLYKVLKMRMNPLMSSFTARNTMVANTLLYGNGYGEIVRRGDGRPQAVIPIESSRVRPRIEDSQLIYYVQTNAGQVKLLPRDIIHIPGLSFDGISGLSVIAHAKRTIGAALSADDYSEALMRQGIRPSGVLSHPAKLGPDGMANLRESFQATYAGPVNSGKPLILEEGMTWTASGMSLEEAQWIESNYFRVEDICRWFGVPPHKVQNLLRATNNNIEQQSLDFLGDSVSPWVEVIEQEMNWKLFMPEEQDRFYCEHLTQAIIQMDANTRGAFYERLIRIGAISPDEIREMENMNHVPDGRGKVYWIQSSNMPLPTEAQRDQLVDSWIKKGASPPGGANGPGDGSGQPNPKTDGQVAGAS